MRKSKRRGRSRNWHEADERERENGHRGGRRTAVTKEKRRG